MKIGNRRVLEKIIELDGNCLDHRLCNTCPFAVECLSKVSTQGIPTAQQRVNKALDKLTLLELMDDENDSSM